MPVIATLGALSYARALLGGNLNYWAISFTGLPSNTIPINNVFLNNDIYMLSQDNNLQADLIKIVGLVDPNIGYNYTYSSTTAGAYFYVGRMSYDNVNQRLVIPDSKTANYTPTFPFYPVKAPELLYVDNNTGLLDTSKSAYRWPLLVPPINANSSFTKIVDTFFDSNNNLYTMIEEDGQNNVIYGTFRYDGSTLVKNGSFGPSSVSYQVKGTVDNSDQPITFNTAATGGTVRLYTNSATAGTSPTFQQNQIYGTQFSLTGQTLIAKDLVLDSSQNRILGIDNSSQTRGQLIKCSTTQTITWQRRINSLTLTNVAVDSSDNVYVVGNGAGGIWLGKYNSSGSLQWQNKLLANVTITNPIIDIDNNQEIIITCTCNTKPLMIRLPNTGSIPGTGTYVVGSITLTYSAASLTEQSGTVTTSAAPGTNGITNNQIYNVPSITNTSTVVSTTVSKTFLS